MWACTGHSPKDGHACVLRKDGHIEILRSALEAICSGLALEFNNLNGALRIEIFLAASQL